jgi:hypothetical protein
MSMLDRPTARRAHALQALAPKEYAKSIARHTALVDENRFVDWLIDAKPGGQIVYYRGHLAYDRTPAANVLDNRSRAIVHAVAGRVMATTGKGLVLPVQKRLGTGDYLYIAVKALPNRISSRRGESLPPFGIRTVPVVAAAAPAPAALAA